MKPIANNNNYDGFQPVPTGSDHSYDAQNVHDAHVLKGHDAHSGARHGLSSMPVHKRLLFDPFWFRWITTTVWAISVGVTFGVLGDFSMFNIFLAREFGSSVAELSWLGALPWCLTCIFSPLSNVIARALGYRLTMVISCLICAAGLVATSFIHELWPAFLSYSLMVGGSSVVIYTAGCVYTTQFFDKKHCTGPVSTGGMCFEIAILIYSPVINITANAWGWRWCIRLLGGIAFVYTGLLLCFIRPPPRNMFMDDVDEVDSVRKDSKSLTGDLVEVDGKTKNNEVVVQAEEAGVNDNVGEDNDEEGGENDDTHVSSGGSSSFRIYLELLRKPSFCIYVIGVVVSFITLSFTHINLGSYLTAQGVADDKIALMHSLLAGGALLGRAFILLVHLLPFSIVLTYPILSVTAAMCSVAVTVVSETWIFYGYAFLMGIIRGQYFSLSTGIAVELSGRSRAAEAYAMTFVSWGIGSALAAVLPGVTHQLTGSYKLAMVLGAALWGVSVVLFTVMYVIHRKRGTCSRAHRLKSDPERDVDEEKKSRLGYNLGSSVKRKGQAVSYRSKDNRAPGDMPVAQGEHYAIIEKLSSV